MAALSNRTCRICDNSVRYSEVRSCSECTGGRGNEPSFYCHRTCVHEDCRKVDCTEPGHLSCWDAHLPRLPLAASLHREVDPLHELFVSSVTYSESDSNAQMSMHASDRSARWFRIKFPDSTRDFPQLQVYDRYRQLCNPGFSGNRWTSTQYPSFTSFIGNTCVGKSTLLRAMLLMGPAGPLGRSRTMEMEATHDERLARLQELLDSGLPGPVTRTATTAHLWAPTSLGVHLYEDVSTSGQFGADSSHPILFADCEGFRAGFATTNSERIASESSSRDPSQNGHSASQSSSLPPRWSSSESSMIINAPITAECYIKGGKVGAELFYARFLYAISDVVVFVAKEDSSLEFELQKLLEWTASAVYNSVNRVAQKSLVIVRNMPLAHDPDLYHGEKLKRGMFDNLSHLWIGSEALTEFVDGYNQMHRRHGRRILRNEDLFDVFFKNISACYIPDKTRAPAGEIYSQYRELRSLIDSASRDGQMAREKSWMQYNVPALSHILTRAFQHFRTSEQPFDFYIAARNDNPNPISMTDHIVNFLRHAQMISGRSSKLSDEVISVALLVWAFRQFGEMSEPEEMYRRELDKWCTDAFQLFRQRHKMCSYRFSDASQCVERRISHYNGVHSDGKGQRDSGDFEDSKEDSDSITQIHEGFVTLYEQFWDARREKHGLHPRDYQSHIRERKLGEFHSDWKRMKSNKTCFPCLQAVPDHVLPCGHAYCACCIREFAHPSALYDDGYLIDRCVLCRKDWGGQEQLIRLKPRCAGVRVLSLDGGGIRGVVSLALLEALEKKIGLEVQFREFFDLIVGTSTGGIIGLSIALNPFKNRPNDRLGDLKKLFMELAETTFKQRREGYVMSKLDYFNLTSKFCMITRIWDSIYPPRPLRDCLQRIFGVEIPLFGSAPYTNEQRQTRVAVTSSKGKGDYRCLIANYNRRSFASGAASDREASDDFEREDEGERDMRVWEAGMATSAAPFYFPPFEKKAAGKEYVDGALHVNCPASYALEEAGRIWPDTEEPIAPLDYLITVGTGVQKREVHIPMVLKIRGFEEICTRFQNMVNSERLWREFESGTATVSRFRDKIHRLNAEISGNYVALDDHRKMSDLNEMVKEQTTYTFGTRRPPLEPQISFLADKLVANLFYFEPEGSDGKGTVTQPTASANRHRMAGSIRCRLARKTLPLQHLADRSWIEGFWKAEYSSDRTEELNWQPIQFTNEQRTDIRTLGGLFRIPFTIETAERTEARQVIAVAFRGKRPDIKLAISGFPVTFKELQRRAATG